MVKVTAEIFEIWEDTRIQQDLTREAVASDAGIPLKYYNELVTKGVMADQVPRLMRLEQVLRTPPLPESYYTSGKIFEIYEDARVNVLKLTREAVARKADLDIRWYNDLMMRRKICAQYTRVKRISKALGTTSMSDKFYISRPIQKNNKGAHHGKSSRVVNAQ